MSAFNYGDVVEVLPGDPDHYLTVGTLALVTRGQAEDDDLVTVEGHSDRFGPGASQVVKASALRKVASAPAPVESTPADPSTLREGDRVRVTFEGIVGADEVDLDGDLWITYAGDRDFGQYVRTPHAALELIESPSTETEVAALAEVVREVKAEAGPVAMTAEDIARAFHRLGVRREGAAS